MNRFAAWALVATLAASTVAALTLPVPVVTGLAIVSLLAIRQRRWTWWTVAATTLALHAALFGFLLPGPPTWSWGALSWSTTAASIGLRGGLRLVAVLAVNLVVLSWVSVQRVLDGLGLPAAMTSFLGAVVLSTQDLGRDAQQLVHATQLDGRWPDRTGPRLAAAARLTPALLVLAVRRATTRAEALRLAGHATGPQFAALVAVTALAMVGRMAFVALPNISLTYVVVFAGGLLFGSRLGATAGALAMTLTNLLLTGAYLPSFANVPAMAFIGLLGGLLQTLDMTQDHWLGRLTAGAIGFVTTLAFSALADGATWLLVPEFRGDTAALRILLTAGIAFNAIPAAVNAALFALAVAPLSRAAQAVGWIHRRNSRLDLARPAP